MLRIGITGGIGSGKTTVAKIFEVLGTPVYYADDAAKNLLNENEPLKRLIIQHFGETTYNNGQLNRAVLSSLVFNDPEKLALLNSLVHPVTIADADKWMRAQTAPYTLKEAALIFETDAWKHLDYVIGVKSPPELRLKRTMLRDDSTAEAVQKRMDKQMNEEEKMGRCNFIIENDDHTLLIPQVVSLHEKLLLLASEPASNPFRI
ncbi:dephospho-CoA kinase [Ferruginibacter sp. HRS2-29]|uniref:dephospho-CoA kinase n=1 Tax=Ferruginibacter sp. HRS2-29 TaxID=2487334 RepID=UPI0020CFD9F4|nr:dephospho-CoA kinase [Ferruginibacter sp. HRS2-29]